MQRKKQAVLHNEKGPGKHVDGKHKGREKRFAFNVYTNPHLEEVFVKPLKNLRPLLVDQEDEDEDEDDDSWDLFSDDDDDACDESQPAAPNSSPA